MNCSMRADISHACGSLDVHPNARIQLHGKGPALCKEESHITTGSFPARLQMYERQFELGSHDRARLVESTIEGRGLRKI